MASSGIQAFLVIVAFAVAFVFFTTAFQAVEDLTAMFISWAGCDFWSRFDSFDFPILFSVPSLELKLTRYN